MEGGGIRIHCFSYRTVRSGRRVERDGCQITTKVTGPWSEDVESKIGKAHGSGAPLC